MVYTGTKNDMKIQRIPAVALNESNNHGDHYFMSLYTGTRMYSFQWTEIPIYYDVVA